MDAIADTTIAQVQGLKVHVSEEAPSLLALLIETNPQYWKGLKLKANVKAVIEALIVGLNAHLAVNNSNKVVVIAAHSQKARFLFPVPQNDTHSTQDVKQEGSGSPPPTMGNGESKRQLKNKNIYRQFKIIDESVLDGLEQLINESQADNVSRKSTLPGAISLALTYINRVRQLNESLSMSARLLVVSIGNDTTMSYIPTMNSIFAAQRMKVAIDICKLGEDSTFLQQAADISGGVYLLVSNPLGLIQYLSTVFFIDPSIRNYVALPVNNDIDFRASCFVTGSIVDVGYVCSVCLCVLKDVPASGSCPICDSKFDPVALERLQRKPVVPKRKTATNGASVTPVPTPAHR